MSTDAQDAARYRWLKQYLRVERDKAGDWTCWIILKMIPFRSQTENPEVILDDLMKRFPMKEKK